MAGNLSFDLVYPYPPERVWHALTDQQALSRWLMDNDFEPRVGHIFHFRTKPAPGFNGIVRCEVREVDPPHRLSYTWESGKRLSTLVTWTLEAVPAGTRLRLEHTGFDGFNGLVVRTILGLGWRKILRKVLPAHLATVTT